MTIQEWLQKHTQPSRLDAELILLHAINHITPPKASTEIFHTTTNGRTFTHTTISKPLAEEPSLDRSWLVLHADDALSVPTLNLAKQLYAQRLQGKPLAYILGTKEFYGYNFVVTPDVLIPRPETEVAIDISLNLCYNEKIGSVLDVGTGSGCIAIALALELKAKNLPISILALDNSKTALAIAKQNAENLGAEVQFLYSNLLDVFLPSPNSHDSPLLLPDLIIANLPYVDPKWPWNSPALCYEPANALYAKQHGLELIFRFIQQVANISNNSASVHHLVLEADTCQHAKIIAFAQKVQLKLIEQKELILHFVTDEKSH